MREIKFRGFSEKRKIMEYDIAIDNEGRGIRRGYQWWSRENDLLFSPIMQYTGLKDKNGKEIFEGDILADGQNRYYEIKFNDGSFLLFHDFFG